MKLITHFHQLLSFKYEWTYTSTPPPSHMPSRHRQGQLYLLPLLCCILLYKNLNPHCSVSKAAGFEMDNQGSVFFRAAYSFLHPVANDPGAVWSPVQ